MSGLFIFFIITELLSLLVYESDVSLSVNLYVLGLSC